jgi:hypothetical protein
MDESTDKDQRDELLQWIKQQLDSAVRELIKKNRFDSLLVKAKPAWVHPFQVLIGKVREQDQPKVFEWLICGEVPTDLVGSSVASTPREAARYFAMKWQLEVARHNDLSGQITLRPVPELREPGSQLTETAEALYALADDEKLWQQKDGF